MAYDAPAPKSDRPALPEYKARKGDGPMDDEEFCRVVQDAVAQSVSFVDNELSSDRARATEYYLGKPFGNEEEGRSQVILTELRDAVDGMIPSFCRVFFGSEHAVEFAPNKADTVEQAAQMTDYVRFVFEQDNGGFLKTVSVLKDGLIRKIGIFKWGWDTSEQAKAYRQEALDRKQMELLAADDAVENMQATKRKDGTYDVEFTRKYGDGCARLWAVPPEEFIYNREARSPDEALLLMHRTRMTRGQLLAMGISEKDIVEHAGTDDDALRGNAEEIARRDIERIGKELSAGIVKDPDMGSANDKIPYGDGLMRIDVNGDGIAELRRVHCIGPTYYPVKHYPADDSMGFAIFTPYPEPHALLGGSVADRTMDVQKINSTLLRSMLDSLAASIFPRTAYQEGQVSVPDIMNTAIGAPMRTRGDPNQVIRSFEVPFVGKEALPMLAFMQEVIERRTGRNKGAAGLDADALQSTGKDAVNAVLTGSQEQLEMIARVFAEMTLKPLFKGLAKLLIQKQPRERMVRLRGKWVEVDPRQWDSDLDVTVNVALGSSFVEKKVQTLGALIADQDKLAAETGGVMSPVAPLPKRMNARAQILKLQGIQDVENYITMLPANWQPPAPPVPPPSPEQMALEGEKQMNQLKTVKELAIEQDKLAFEREEAEWRRDFDTRKWAADVELRKYQIDAEYHGTMTQAQMDANIATEKHEAELTIVAHDQLHDQHLERQSQAHEQGLAEDAQAHDQEMAQQAADTQAQQGGGE
jgi:hypothetical protein